MGCDEVENRKGQVIGHMCVRGRRQRPVPCSEPGCPNESSFLCDAQLPGGKTCDKPICRAHRRRQANVASLADARERRRTDLDPVTDSVDFCPGCDAAPAPPRQLGLALGAL